MAFELFFALVILTVLLVGSYTDIKTREVPDIINYGFIISAIAIRAIFSLAYSDWAYFVDGIFGFIAFVILAYIMFYAGQWGGGDAKMIMGLGAMIGLPINIIDITRFSGIPLLRSFLASFLFNTLVVGAIYALVWSIILVLKNKKRFVVEYYKLANKRIVKIGRFSFLAAAFIILLLSIFLIKDIQLKIMLSSFAMLCAITIYLWLFVKAVERSAMLKYIDPEKLTEGDWIAKDVVVNGKRICGPKDLGIEMRQIRLLIKLKKQRKIKKVLIKEGIPFVPSFLTAFIITYFFGNILFLLIG
ncbi:MAG: A24 family peptidase [Candidatus Woesearchaeota archaeon]|nr:A24 family peptidase [Candidatus Woesearchaeota archaeon]